MFVVKDSPPTGELVFAEGQLVLQAGRGQKVENLGLRGRDDSGNCPKVREMRNCRDALIVFQDDGNASISSFCQMDV